MTTLALPVAFLAAAQSETAPRFDSFWDMLVRGGPVMILLGICSVIALTWTMERALRLRGKLLGTRAQADALVSATRDGGPARALELARSRPTLLARVLQPVYERWSEPRESLEKSVEDVGSRELRAMVTSLRPLSVITALAPLLGLLGTVIGIIIAFRDIALSDAMGKPEALAAGIGQALVTTATGLAIAIPTQAAFYWFRGRIDRFARLLEDAGERVLAVHTRPSERSAPPGSPLPHAEMPAVPLTSVAQGTP
jgi:biopolymer transport protein ExbB